MAQKRQDTVDDLRRRVTELENRLRKCRDERDEALAKEREALEHQSATSAILHVISASSTDAQPTFDAIVGSAAKLCDAEFTAVARLQDGLLHLVATNNLSEEEAHAFHSLFPRPAVRNFLMGRAFVEKRTVQIDDVLAERDYDPRTREVLQTASGYRTFMAVPIFRSGEPIGVIGCARRRVQSFTAGQIELLNTFAQQASIALDNVRLFDELGQRNRDLTKALEYQTATSDVLKVISRSTFDLQPVLDALVETAARLCGADGSGIALRDGDVFRYAALHAVYGIEEYSAFLRQQTFSPGRGTTIGRVALEGDVVHITDITVDPDYSLSQSSTVGKIRTNLGVPLLREGAVIGMLTLFRQHVEPFTERQIDLVRTFADQAVIAIENSRLITETREALEQQTATAEVLQVINSSPGDLTPVFGAVLERATRLCNAVYGHLQLYDGEFLNPVAVRGDAQYVEWIRQRGPVKPPPGVPMDRLLRGEEVVHIPNARQDASYKSTPLFRAQVDAGDWGSSVAVALRKDGATLGTITVFRQQVGPFSGKQIALLQNFAAQAVIAMENARLLTETRESLEQQTATAEVLGVINSSPGDLGPVFDALLDRAMHLCGAAFGAMTVAEEDHLRTVATRGVPQAYRRFREQNPPPSTAPIARRILAGAPYVHTLDLKAEEVYQSGDPQRRALVDLGGARTSIAVALVKDGRVLGAIHVYRTEVQAFSEKQIALLQNFAAQAVIAMENARLITETREALEQQTATAEVLGVINSSPGDLAPVFEAMLERAHALCSIDHGVFGTFDGERFRAVATRGLTEPLAALVRQPFVASRGSPHERLVRGEPMVRIEDLTADTEWPHDDPKRVATVAAGVRSMVFVPLRKDGRLLGFYTANRREARPFGDREIALLQSFAAQAVIAMENARLITETREALEQQTATSEVLQIINSSPGDLTPVFDAMLEKAARLCNAGFGLLWLYEADEFRAAAVHAVPATLADFVRKPLPVEDAASMADIVHGQNVVHVSDLADSVLYRSGNPARRAYVDLGGARTLVSVALRKDNALLGALNIYRQEVRPFSDKEIRLVENFAAQAVIAMENARLITETREALEQQTATAEVLGVINSSPGDLGPVFESILEKAHNLCGVAYGSLELYENGEFRAVAVHGLSEALANHLRQGYAPGPKQPVSRLLEGDRYVHVDDLAEIDDPMARRVVELGGTRTLLWVALRKDERLLGMIAAARLEVRPFSDKEIALLESFAAQAVIAMENARLLNEIRQRQAELRVTFDNMADGVAMFGEDMRLAAWNRNFQQIADIPEDILARRPSYADYLKILTERGELNVLSIDTELSHRVEDTQQELRLERTRPNGQVIEVRRNAVPDGGFVLIYSDITERKRSEAEIRAARDAAEAAYRDLKAAQANLVQAEKMASLGQLTAGIAHEIKNPLNFVNNFAGLSVELLDELTETAAPAFATLDEKDRADVDETVELLTGNLEKIAEHGKRADNIVKSMLEHSRGTTGERRSVDLNALVEEALNLAYHGGRAQDQSFNITLERDYDSSAVPIELVPQDITRVCLNLFGNGFYAATKRQNQEGDPKFKPILKVTTRDLGDAVEIRARDNGGGIPAEIRDKLFQPFFTTKPTGEGTGLGLSISYDIVTQQHGGTIDVDSKVGEFTEFIVLLPRNHTGRAAA